MHEGCEFFGRDGIKRKGRLTLESVGKGDEISSRSKPASHIQEIKTKFNSCTLGAFSRISKHHGVGLFGCFIAFSSAAGCCEIMVVNYSVVRSGAGTPFSLLMGTLQSARYSKLM